MNSRDFCFWLQGCFELTDPKHETHALSVEQVKTIKAHLALVFVHEIDPSMGGKEHQAKLNEIHQYNPLKPNSLDNPTTGSGEIMRC